MSLTRREALAVAAALPLLRADEKKKTLGIVIHSYAIAGGLSRKRRDKPGFSDPLTFLKHCQAQGADGVQVGLGVPAKEDAAAIRKWLDSSGMYLEGIVRLPSSKTDAERFAGELQAAKALGATILRTVCLSGRRYETFTTAEAFRDFAKRSRASLEIAEPIAARAGVQLAVENHKDWRIDELLAVLKHLSSKHVGVCLDTGNSVALLEEPHAVVEAYAPHTLTTHLKDMAVAEYEDGFL